jgi:hypothetical protein
MRLPREPLRPNGGFVGPLQTDGRGGGEMFVDVGAYGTPKVGDWGSFKARGHSGGLDADARVCLNVPSSCVFHRRLGSRRAQVAARPKNLCAP